MSEQMVEHFEDVNHRIKELGNVAAMVVIEAVKVTDSIFEDRSFYPSVLEVLSHLVASYLIYDEIKLEYKQRERQNEVERRINEAVKRKQ